MPIVMGEAMLMKARIGSWDLERWMELLLDAK
jgi:hypothetical protein